MSKKKSKLQLAQDKAQSAINKTNEIIEKLGSNTNSLYSVLYDIQELFDKIRNVPNEKRLQYEKLKDIRLNWKQQAEKIEKDYCPACYRSNHSGRCADCENWSKLGHKVQHRALYTYNGAMKEYFSKYKFIKKI